MIPNRGERFADRIMRKEFRVWGRVAGIRRPRWRNDLNGTGLVPVPANFASEAGFLARRDFDPNSNPGIRRPRWGGVVEGVAGQSRHPLAYVRGDWKMAALAAAC